MAKFANLARMTTATVGPGTITLGSAVAGFLTFAQAGIANGEIVSYGIRDGNNSEVGTGTYSSAGTTLTRSVTKSTNADAAISLSGSAQVEVFITPRAEDMNEKAPLASPVFTGDPQAPTPATADNDTSIATTAFVKAQGYITSSALSPYAPLASPALSGNPTAPTPTGGDNDTSIATTAFVQGEIAAKAPLASPSFTGNPTAPTPTANDNDTSIATTAFVLGQLSNAAPPANDAASAGSATTGARSDHKHPTGFRDYAWNPGTSDLNAIITQGYYELNSFTNGPSDIGDGWCLLQVHRHSNTSNQYLVQHLTTMTTSPVKVYYRECVNGSWGSWIRLDNRATLDSPAFTGNPTAPTPANADNDTSIATTAFVKNSVQMPASADFNALTDPGVYFSQDNTNTNAPVASAFWFLQVYKMTGGSALVGQIAMNMTTGLCYRRVYNGSWQAWVQIVDVSLLATAAQYLANDSASYTNYLTPWAAWNAASFVTLTDAATVTPDFDAGINFSWTVGAAGRTLANPTNLKSQSGVIWLTQNASGTGTITSWGTAWKFPGGVKPSLTTTANATDMIAYTAVSGSIIACTHIADIK